MSLPFALLDVSLRDGGHRNNFHFDDETLTAVLEPLDASGVDYIEVGYRNGSIRPDPGIGVAGLCPRPFLERCAQLIRRSGMAVMAHPQNVGHEDLLELKDCGTKLLRLCVARGGVELARPVIDLAQAVGLMISVNFIHASQYEEDELARVVEIAMSHQPDLIYLADSNGSLTPHRVTRMYQRLATQKPVRFGFHGHDNLGLAQTNTLAAMQAGASFVDAALAGMGKGIGNLKTEIFAAYLHATGDKRYSLDALLGASNFVRIRLGIGNEELEMDELLRGISDLSTAEVKALGVTLP